MVSDHMHVHVCCGVSHASCKSIHIAKDPACDGGPAVLKHRSTALLASRTGIRLELSRDFDPQKCATSTDSMQPRSAAFVNHNFAITSVTHRATSSLRQAGARSCTIGMWVENVRRCFMVFTLTPQHASGTNCNGCEHSVRVPKDGQGRGNGYDNCIVNAISPDTRRHLWGDSG